MAFDGKIIAITGGASGIGLATAQSLSKKGATVCLCDIDPDAMKKTEMYFSELGVPFSMTKVDISIKEQVEAWIQGIINKYGKLDGAVNNAGIIGKHHGLRAVADLDDDEWHKLIAINLTGTMFCLRAELRKIVDGGSIVNLSSIHGLQGFAMHGAYDATKHAVIGLTKAAAKENGYREVRVNAVAPGSIHTPLMDKSFAFHGKPLDSPFDDTAAFGRHGKAEEVAGVIVFLLSPESRYVSGSVYSVDGAMT